MGGLAVGRGSLFVAGQQLVRLRDRLAETHPEGGEDREAFIVRLRNAVSWLNVNKRGTLRKLCRNQKVRAEDVDEQDGHKTQW